MNRLFEILVVAVLVIGFGTIVFNQNRTRFCPTVENHDHPLVEQQFTEIDPTDP